MRLPLLFTLATFVFLPGVLPLWGQFGGPAILSRGEAPAAMAAPNIRLRPFLEVSGVYDTGLQDARLTDNGALANTASEGIRLNGGLNGSKSWRRTTIGLDYNGNYTRYRLQTVPTSFSQSLLLGVNHQVTRHLALSFRETAGMFTRDFGLAGLSATVPFDPATTVTPITDYFDNRTYYSTTQAQATLQKSTRLSFNWGGGFFLNKRSSSSLHSVTGEMAQGDVQYRLTRTSTVGAVYTYNRYGFNRGTGGTDMHIFAGSYAVRPTRRIEFTGQAGVARVESKFLMAQNVDPVIAQLLGLTSTVQIVHTIANRPYGEARLSRVFSRGVAYISGGSSVTPGNGVFLTSYMSRIIAGYQYTGMRRWSFGAQGGDTFAESTGQTAGNYGGATGTVSVTRSFGRSAHLIGSFSVRQYQSRDFAQYNRLICNAIVGIGFSPGDVPLRAR